MHGFRPDTDGAKRRCLTLHHAAQLTRTTSWRLYTPEQAHIAQIMTQACVKKNNKKKKHTCISRPTSLITCGTQYALPRLSQGNDCMHGTQGEELQYLTALMMQSEHWGWPQAAASFAQAAMHRVKLVYSPDNAPQSEEDRADWTRQRHNQESMFCANLFVYALEGGRYEVRPTLACCHNTQGANEIALCCVLDVFCITSMLATCQRTVIADADKYQPFTSVCLPKLWCHLTASLAAFVKCIAALPSGIHSVFMYSLAETCHLCVQHACSCLLLQNGSTNGPATTTAPVPP